jgi:uncharacterized protein
MQYFLLIYHLVDDYIDRRQPLRDEHLRLAREANARGELVLAGAVEDPADRAYLVFRTPSAGIVEAFAREDPYVTNGLVKRFEVRDWKVVIGDVPSEKSGAAKT